MAGSLAYHAFISLLPLLLLLLAISSTLGAGRLESALLSLTRAAVTPGAGEVLVAELRRASPGASALGVAVLLWGTLRIFRSLDTAFSDIYESGTANTVADQFADGLVVLVSVAAVVLVVAAIDATLSVLSASAIGRALRNLVLVTGVGLALLPMYYVFPDEPDLTVPEVLPGVAFAAVGLVAFQSLFRLYLAYSATASRESALASIIVFLTWLYFSGLVVLVGVAVNAVLTNRSADVSLEPVIGGVPPTGDAPGGRPDGATLARLVDDLASAETVSVVVDGEETALPPLADVNWRDSSLPFVDDVTIELVWRDEVPEQE